MAAAAASAESKFVPSTSYDGSQETAKLSQTEINKRLAKVETYQKYLQKQQEQMLQRRNSGTEPAAVVEQHTVGTV